MSGWNLLKARKREAKAKSDFFAGDSSTHPHGRSGLRWIVLPECGNSQWDTAPRAFEFSEWGNLAGLTP